MSSNDRHDEAPTSRSTAGAARAQVCVLLACFDGVKTAAKVRRPLGKQIRESGGVIQDEVVGRVDAKRKVQVYDPRRTLAGALTAALTWGVFGLLTGGGLRGLLISAVIGAICGGLYAYYKEHMLTATGLNRIGARLPPDSSAILAYVRASDAARVLACTVPYHPSPASVAAIAADLSARVVSSPSNPVESPSLSPGASQPPESDTLLRMLLFRHGGERTARGLEAYARAAQGRSGQAIQIELLLEVDRQGTVHVTSPSAGMAAMAKNDVVSWGLLGVVFGALAGSAGGGGMLGFLEGGLVTGIAWAIFGLVAGALYGLWWDAPCPAAASRGSRRSCQRTHRSSLRGRTVLSPRRAWMHYRRLDPSG